MTRYITNEYDGTLHQDFSWPNTEMIIEAWSMLFDFGNSTDFIYLVYTPEEFPDGKWGQISAGATTTKGAGHSELLFEPILFGSTVFVAPSTGGPGNFDHIKFHFLFRGGADAVGCARYCLLNEDDVCQPPPP
jgi:hypothetical protein